ncbi:MAG: 16S rRNA (cytidine(1402)-2'-O)-methyltransferase [Bacilli bacterium]|nr:16S rRNA (cytidine(1402)-2'-O)-methyltransferase [Bacilli bacterium]
MSQKSYNGNPTLYLVPTPIGNLSDMTYRGVETLNNSEVIFSEDTRESKKLLDYFDIKKKLIPCHKFNEDDAYLKVLDYLNQGFDVSIITDRGTPCISDPGYVSVFKVIKSGYNVVCLPGATAFTPALVNSGLNPNNFLFYGFLNSKKSAKKKELEELKLLKYTIIFYESPFRIIETLELIKEIMGNRNVSISREISKKHEEVYRGTIEEVIKELEEPKGEFVIILDGNKDEENYDDIDIIDHINMLVNKGMRDIDAIKEVSKLHNMPKNEVYKMYLEVKK